MLHTPHTYMAFRPPVFISETNVPCGFDDLSLVSVVEGGLDKLLFISSRSKTNFVSGLLGITNYVATRKTTNPNHPWGDDRFGSA